MSSPAQHHSYARPLARALCGTTVAAAVLLAASACGAGESSTDTAAAAEPSGSSGGGTSGGVSLSDMEADVTTYTDPPTGFAEISPVTGGAETLRGKTIWYIPIGGALPYMDAIAGGADEAFAALGAQLKVCDGKFQPTEIASCMDQAAQQGADAVITSYVDYQLVPNSFDALVDAGIPVLVGGQAASGGKSDSAEMAFYDTIETQLLLERLQAETVILDADGKANVLMVGVTDSTQTRDASDYHEDFYTQNCPDCTVARIDYTNSGLGKVPSDVSAALITDPETDHVALTYDPVAGAVATAIQTAGRTDSVKLSGAGGGLDSMQRLESGRSQFADIAISGNYVGWQFADGVVRMLTGNPVEIGVGLVRVFTTDNVGDVELTPGAYKSNDWYGGDDFQATFTGAWGIS